jgi:hypothetical protein
MRHDGFFSGSAAYDAVITAYKLRLETWSAASAAADLRLAAVQRDMTDAQAAVTAYTAALCRITYQPYTPVAVDFVAEMEAVAAANPFFATEGLGRAAVDALSSFLCDVEADRQARATLESQLCNESARADDANTAAEALQVCIA